MRIFLIRLIILTLASMCTAYAADTATPPLLQPLPAQSTPAAARPPGWLPLQALPSTAPPSSVGAPLPGKPQADNRPASSRPENKKTPSGLTSTSDESAPKNPKSTVRKKGTTARQTGLGNNIPPYLAATAVDPETANHPTSPWPEVFYRLKNGRQVTATPPLLAGIKAQHIGIPAEEPELHIRIESILTKKLVQPDEGERPSDTLDMLSSLVELQKNIKQHITVTSKKLKSSSSESEKQALQAELTQLDKQLGETSADFERIATGVAPEIFSEQKKASFSWKDELATLLEPSIKELKQLTARARQKSELKETIADYNKQLATARRAVAHLNKLINETKNTKIKGHLSELLPAWQNMEKRVSNKLDLSQRELAKLEDKDGSLLQSSGNSVREFFRDRGWYLLIAIFAFVAILLACRLLARMLFYILPGARREQRPVHIRILDIFFQIFSVISAIFGLIFVLYTAEDWLLLSATIILFLGMAWTVRQALPKMWQQVRLVLNMGAIREGERVVYNGVPWKVESLNVFCKLYNPALGMHLRIPIENMLGLISRPYQHDEPWFPCKKGDWVAIDGKPFAKVTSLTHEQVEVVELGGRRLVYQTADFLGKSPANLSRNFNLRLVFGLSYDLQNQVTTSVLTTLKNFLQQRLEEQGYAEDCLSLSVDFLQAGASSLDVVVLADFKGEQAAAYRRIERALAKGCVDCATANNWEIPYPQMTVHMPTVGATKEQRGELYAA